ncbi:MAG: YbaK/EbsC family protein [Desulfuromonadaceae bacterium]
MVSFHQVKTYLASRGLDVLEFTEPTATAETAAAAVGCSLAEIAKSMLLLVGGEPVLVVTCGDMKVKSSKLKKAAGLTGKVIFPDADQVLRYTGYAPGGVCPFLLPAELPVLLDESLRRFPTIYPAAGNACSAVALDWRQLAALTGGYFAALCDAVTG